MKRLLPFLLVALTAPPLVAQREFLTNDEIDKVRDAQEPNLRLKLYLTFARQRLDQIQQQIARDKKGRSLLVRQLLEDYTQIVDAIDTVSDDALKRRLSIGDGGGAVLGEEKKFLAQLKKIEESNPHDLDMYQIALKDAEETTSDSIATASEDVGRRSEVLAAKAAEEKKKLAEETGADRLKEQKTEDAKADKGDDGKPKRKPPTLYRPGEKPADPNQP